MGEEQIMDKPHFNFSDSADQQGKHKNGIAERIGQLLGCLLVSAVVIVVVCIVLAAIMAVVFLGKQVF